jgi:hypothetical protein
MIEFTDEFFETALAGVQERLEDLVTQPKDEGDPSKKHTDKATETWSKSMSALMKTKADLLAQRDAQQARDFAKQHTRYEDMPPPTPEDEARFHDRFDAIMRDIQSARNSKAGKPDG